MAHVRKDSHTCSSLSFSGPSSHDIGPLPSAPVVSQNLHLHDSPSQGQGALLSAPVVSQNLHLHDSPVTINSQGQSTPHVHSTSQSLSVSPSVSHDLDRTSLGSGAIQDDVAMGSLEETPFSVTGGFPDGGDGNDVQIHSPYNGDYTCSSWNTQALFAAKVHSQCKKRRVAMSLINKHDFTCYQETHSQDGSAKAFNLPQGHVAIWSHGTTRQAGIGIVLKHSFLKQFNRVIPERDFDVIIPGRAAILRLSGPLGNLDIACVYMDATCSATRRAAIRQLGANIRPKNVALTILSGDFNFVMSGQDRWSTATGDWAANGDMGDAEVLKDHVLKPFSLIEFEQDMFTCEATTGARSRLDRIYQNQHISMQLDRACKAHVDAWCTDLSTHRPVCASRTAAGKKDFSVQPMQNWAFKHEHFGERTLVEFRHLCTSYEGPLDAVSKLLMLKEAISNVHDNIVQERAVIVSEDVEDRLGWTIMCARYLEQRKFDKVETTMRCFPSLRTCGKQHDRPSCSLHTHDLACHINAVRDLAIDLAREDINHEISQLRNNHSEQGGDRAQHKEHILRKLKRISPGESAQLRCIIDEHGNFHSDPGGMAKALCAHWKEVFGPTRCDDGLLREWMSQLFPRTSPDAWSTGLLDKQHVSWKVLKKHVRKAIRYAKNTMPGPDGIPACAYKVLGEVAVDALYDVFEVLASDAGEDTLNAAYASMTLSQIHAFNNSILCCLPKKPTGHDDNLGDYYHAGATRPLNVSNVDNRLLASAARLAWEPILERWVSKMQRGFLKGRVMLHNVIDIDWEAMKVSLKHQNGALVLFDFKAAFPSVGHDFLINSLTYLGVPHFAMNFIHHMYQHNHCVIRMQGGDFPGFDLLGGVRQGCPLSPLLFAVCVDILLRMLDLRVPNLCARAFADDIASIVTDWWTQGPILYTVFEEFGRISNLYLNIDKTICIPLWPQGSADIAGHLPRHIPGWQNLIVASKGPYLGFIIGPGCGQDSWKKPLAKYKDRVARWFGGVCRMVH